MSTTWQVLGEAGKRLRGLPKLPVRIHGWRTLKWIASFLFVIGVVVQLGAAKPEIVIEPAPRACATHTVSMQASRFEPSTLTVRACDTVSWIIHNQDQVPHSVTSGNLGANAGSVFDSRANPNTCTEDGNQSGCMRSPATFPHTFLNPGTFPYHCVVHGALGMIGTIITVGPPSLLKPVHGRPPFLTPAVFAMLASSFYLLIATLVLFISLPVYLFSVNAERSNKAGGIVKMTLGFIVGSGGAVLGTLSFASLP